MSHIPLTDIRRGAPLKIQNETEQDLNEMLDLVNLGGGGGGGGVANRFRNGTQQDLNKMVERVKFGRAKRLSSCRKRGKTAVHTC